MSDVKTWSVTASENAAAPPDGWPEGMDRKDVNNVGRETQASVRRFYESPAWQDLLRSGGTSADFAVTKLNDTTLRIAHDTTPTDASAKFPAGARVRLTDNPFTAYQYGYVTSASFSTPNTDVILAIDGAVAILANVDTVELHITTSQDTGRTVGTAAFSDTGTTLAQTPPQVPTIDSLGDGATLDMGAGGGFDADTLDGQEGSYYENLASRRNALVNPGFLCFQRGVTINQTTTYKNDNAKYVADQWALLMGNGVTHPAAGVGEVDIDRATGPQGVARHCIRLTGNASLGGTAPKVGIIQMLESQQTDQFRTGVASASIWCRIGSGSGMGLVQMAIIEWQGTRDALTSIDPIADWSAVGVEPTMLSASYVIQSTVGAGFTPTTSWQEFKIENKAIAAGTNNVGVMIWVDDTSYATGDYIEFTAATLAPSATAIAFVEPNPVDTLSQCERFFAKTFRRDTAPVQNVGVDIGALRDITSGAGSVRMDWRLPTEMLKTPTVVTYSPQNLSASFWDATAGAAVAVALLESDSKAVQILATGAGNYNYIAIHATAEAVL